MIDGTRDAPPELRLLLWHGERDGTLTPQETMALRQNAGLLAAAWRSVVEERRRVAAQAFADENLCERAYDAGVRQRTVRLLRNARRSMARRVGSRAPRGTVHRRAGIRRAPSTRRAAVTRAAPTRARSSDIPPQAAPRPPPSVAALVAAIVADPAALGALRAALAACDPPESTPLRFGGRSLTWDEAANVIEGRGVEAEESHGDALRKAVARAGPGDVLHALRHDGPGRTATGHVLADAARYVRGLLGEGEAAYLRGVAERRAQMRAAKAREPEPDRQARERRASLLIERRTTWDPDETGQKRTRRESGAAGRHPSRA